MNKDVCHHMWQPPLPLPPTQIMPWVMRCFLCGAWEYA
jgi:hypothetical protein